MFFNIHIKGTPQLHSKLKIIKKVKKKKKNPFASNKVFLQTSLKRNPSNLSYIYFSGVNFEDLTVECYVPYIFNMHIKFHSNQMLYTIRSINLYFIHNFRTQKLEILTFI